MNPASELSSLDRIRKAEAEATRSIARGHEEAEQVIQSAKEEARAIVEQARTVGQREGQEQYRRLILQTQDEVRAIGQQSQEGTTQIENTRESHMDVAVRRIVEQVTAAGKNER